MKPWTEHEDGILARAWPNPDSDPARLASAMGRTLHSVQHRAKLLGVVRPVRTWTAAEDATLRDGWGKVRTSVLCATIKRTPNALKLRAIKLGLDAERRYTDEEIGILREMYPTHTAAEIALRIHGKARTALAIYRMASKLGLRKCAALDPADVETVRRLHAEGQTMRQIADAMGWTIDRVKNVQQRLKLPTIPDLESRRRGVAKQYKTLGITSPGQLRILAFKKYAIAHGWLEDLGPRAVQILDALYALGPRTRAQLAVDIDLPTARRGQLDRKSLNRAFMDNGKYGRNTNSYFATLMGKGLVCALGKLPRKGKGNSPTIYSLTLTALQMKGDHLERQKRETQQATNEADAG